MAGDLSEEFARRGSDGAAASRWYWSEVLRSTPRNLLRRLEGVLARKAPDKRGIEIMLTTLQDVGHSLRLMFKHPGFSLVVILTLALGIGANSTVFSAVDSAVLNPFPYPDQGTLVGVGTEFPRIREGVRFFEHLSPPEFTDIRDQSRTLEHVVAWDLGNRSITGADGQPRNVFTAFFWGDAFPTLGVEPVLGRGFNEEEVQRGDAVAVISHRMWQNTFGSDPDILGEVLIIDEYPHPIVGVMPPETLIYGTDLWVTMGRGPEAYARNRRQMQILARIAPDATLDQVQAELDDIADRVEANFVGEFPEYERWRLVPQTWTDINVGSLRTAAWILSASVGFVLLLVCVNLASLILARSNRRNREMALRTSLGASRARLVRQLLTESVILAGLGGLFGLLLAYLGTRGLDALAGSAGIPFVGAMELNSRVLLYTAGISVFVGILFGLAPALYGAGADPGSVLSREGGGQTLSRGGLLLQRGFVGVEVALALCLFVGGGLAAHSFIKLQNVDPGFNPENVLTMRLTLPRDRYPGDAAGAFFQDLVRRTGSLAGVTATAVANQYPPNVFSNRAFSIEGEPVPDEAAIPSGFISVVNPGYFSALEIPVLSGRGLDPNDVAGGVLVAVVNETAARRYFGGEDAVGKRFRIGTTEDPQSPWVEVVGIVGDTKNRGLNLPTEPELFASVGQFPDTWNQLFLMVRAERDAMDALPAVRQVVAEMDSEQPIYAINTIESSYQNRHQGERMAALMLSIFAAFAGLLAAVGIYSIVAYTVSQRTQEIGIRMALGAGAGKVANLMVRQLLLPVALGGLVGLVGGATVGRFLEGELLFEVGGSDPITLVGVSLVFVLLAIVAGYLPARRASRLDPVEALRSE